MQREHTSAAAGSARGGAEAGVRLGLSDAEMTRRHLLADPLTNAVEDLDAAIAILATASAALGNPNSPDTYGLEPIIEVLDLANLMLRKSRQAACETAGQILDGGKGGAA